MKPFSWILLMLGGVFACILLVASITMHTTTQTIQSVDTETYRRVIDTALSSHNKNIVAKDLTFMPVQYVEDSIAVVKATTKSATVFTFVFEYYNDTLFLTNYTTGAFSEDDFNDAGITSYVVNAASQR